MNQSISRILVIVSLRGKDAANILNEIECYFKERNIRLIIYAFEGELKTSAIEGVDLAISLGGDGTLLFCARVCAKLKIPILAVNLGNFGFITEISSNEWREAFENFLAGGLGISQRIMICAEINRNNRIEGAFCGLNDAVIGTLGVSRLIELKLYLSGTYAGRYRADGVIVATPTGSTAYSMGAGGPILDPEMEAFILNPICPFTLSNRSLVVPGSEKIEMEVERIARTEAVLTVDGQEPFPLKEGDLLSFSMSAGRALLVRSDQRTFYDVLRSKLKWSGEPNA